MIKEQVILIKEGGRIEYIYNDKLPLKDLGEVNIGRASSVEFNNKKKKWEVIIKKGQPNENVLYEDDSRENAINWEISYFQNILKTGSSIIEHIKGDKNVTLGRS